MPYIFEQLDCDTYWEEFAGRVRPHLGSLDGLFDVLWRSGIGTAFTLFERSLCREALRREAPIDHWLLRYDVAPPSARRPVASEELFAVAFSLQQAAARLHEDCINGQMLPSAVRLLPGQRRFEFLDGDAVVAAIEPLTLSGPPPAEAARRAAADLVSTLTDGNVDEESMLQLLAAWPGAAPLLGCHLGGTFRRTISLPTLESWVTRAKELLARAHKGPASEAAARELVAAIMGAAHFDQLAKALTAHAATGVQPVLVDSATVNGSSHAECFADIASALPRFMARAVQLVGNSAQDWRFEAGNFHEGFAIDFRRYERDETGQPISVEGADSVSLAVLPIADHDDASGSACSPLADARDDHQRLALLREVFVIGRSCSQRTTVVDGYRDQHPIYEDGFGLRVVVKGQLPLQTFTASGAMMRGNVIAALGPDDSVDDDLFDGHEAGEIHVERVDEHGSVIARTNSVRLDEAGVLYCPITCAYVLTRGAGFEWPVGIIRKLDGLGLRALYSVLGCNMGGPPTEFLARLVTESSSFRNEVDELLREGSVV